MIPTLPPRLPREATPLTLFSRTPPSSLLTPPGARKRRPSTRAAQSFQPSRRAAAHSRRKPRAPSRPLRHHLWLHLCWLVPLLLFDFFFFRWLAASRQRPAPVATATVAGIPAATTSIVTPASLPDLPPPPPPPVWQAMATPTPQQDLLHPDAPGVLQPTGSGRLVSAKFGSTRTRQVGGKFVAIFHEGVDIAATLRDRRGHATDPIFAVADGRVAFVNQGAGNSSYGKYIVIEHPDPSLGVWTNASGTVSTSVVYTLYAHLSDIRFGIRQDVRVTAGQEIATMGHTSNTRPPIPDSRAHLHWEIGLMLNSHYDRMSRENKTGNAFGNYNGLNLFGIDALDFYAAHARDPELTFGRYLDALPPAAELILRGRRPDFFSRYPGLWKGPPPDGSPILLAITESGMPMRGQNATPEQISALGNARQAVWKANPAVLGNNARAYVSRATGSWKVTPAGRTWADAFFY